MKIKWLSKDESLGAVTIYDNNIRLSKKAADYFLDAFAVAVGIDEDNNNIIIKNVSKEEAESNRFDKSRLHKISIKPNYGRITGKQMIDELKVNYGFDFSKKPTYKYSARWNTGDKLLIVEMEGC